MYVIVTDNQKFVAGFSELKDVPNHLLDDVKEVPGLPKITEKFGMVGELYYNGNEMEVRYSDRPLTQEENLQKLQEQQQLMQEAIDELIFGGAL